MLTKDKPTVARDELSFWCTALINGKEIRVKLRHIGRGKFLVVESEANSDHRVIDASDILHCDT